MTKKKLPAFPAMKKASRRVARLRTTTPPLAAHPQLIHGFLVRLARRSAKPVGLTKPASIAVASMTVHGRRLPGTKHEGPTDDATFH